MTDPQTRLITAYYHRVKSAAKHKPSPGVDKIADAIRERARQSG
jgi:hypothetical protein